MEYIIFDLEATCWEGNTMGRTQEIIEIGAIKLDAYGTQQDTFQRFVRPVMDPGLSVYCRKLTGIRQDQVDAAKPFPAVIKQFIDWIHMNDSAYLLCSWGSKDHQLLEEACLRDRIEDDWLDNYIDLKSEYHRIRGLQKKIGLKRTLSKEGLEFEGDHHRALDDARNLTVLFIRYFDMWVR